MILQLFRIYCAKSAAGEEGISVIVQFVGFRVMCFGVGRRRGGGRLSIGVREEEEEGENHFISFT